MKMREIMRLVETVQDLYTVGDPETYEPALDNAEREGGNVMKVGRRGDYPGGSVFTSVEDARQAIKHSRFPYNIYRLGCGIDNTYAIDGEQYGERHLIDDAPIFRL